MKTIELTQDQVAIVDDDDFVWLSQWKWFAHKGTSTFYAVRNVRLPNGDWAQQTMHRAVTEYHGHDIDGRQIDHRNHDGLDNRTSNLRPGTVAENQGNRKHHDDNFIGVYLDRGKWKATIRVNGRKTHIAYCETAHEAALAHDQYIIDHNLSGYPLNFPEVFV